MEEKLSDKIKHNLALPYAYERLIKQDNSKKSPICVTIRPTSICNRHCTFCLCGTRNIEYQGEKLSSHVLANCFSDFEAMEIKGVTIAGGGEPTTINPDEFKPLFESKKISIYLHTNGVLLHKFFPILLPNTKIINFSFIAHNTKLYNNISQKINSSQFEQVIANAINILHNDKFKEIQKQAKILVTRENFQQFIEIYDFYRNLGFEKIKISLVKNYEAGQDCEISIQEKEQLKSILIGKIGIHEQTANNIIYGLDVSEFVPSRCWVSELGLYATVEPDGRVFHCSQWNTDNSVCLGNVNHQSFQSIWYASTRSQIVENLNQRAQMKKCNFKLCRHYMTNIAIDLMLNGKISSENIQKIPYSPFI